MAMTALQQALLTRLAQGDDASAPPISDLLEEAFRDDPAAAPLLSALKAREQAGASATVAPTTASEGGARSVPRNLPQNVTDAETEADVDGEPGGTVADVLEQLYAEVRELRVRVRTLAAALGACPRCWGEDPACPRCLGRGAPGGRTPDALLYHEFVSPAVRRRAARERAVAERPAAPRTPR